MSRKNYRFNPDRLSFTPVERNFKWWFSRAGIFFLSFVILGSSAFFLTSRIVETPSEKNLKAQNQRLLNMYETLDQQLEEYALTLDGLRTLDDSIYRSLVGLNPLPLSLREAGTGGYDRSATLRNAGYPESVVMTAADIGDLQSKLQIQRNSYQDVFRTALRNKEKLEHLPAIMPLSNKDLRRTGSGFGMRLHPILNIVRMHEGMDFHAPTGTPVFATAAGRVKTVRYSETFGNYIEVDHGYGILTLYAHLSSWSVRRGDQVVRGQVIGNVGNTGLSAGSHVHYEVHVNGVEVDPVNYYFHDLSPKEYEMVVAMAQAYETSMD